MSGNVLKSIGRYNRRCWVNPYGCMSGKLTNDAKTAKAKDSLIVKASVEKCGIDHTKAIKKHDNSSVEHKRDVNVCIIGGGAASIYAAVLLKQFRIVKRIHLLDPKDSLADVVFDAGHIDTSTRMKYFGQRTIKDGLAEMDIVALMDETELNAIELDHSTRFNAASNYVRQMSEQILQFIPESLVAVFVQPVTTTLPMISEIYKCAGTWDPNRIIGSTALDSMRISAMTANLLDLNPAFMSVPIVGGADSNTIVPLLSCAKPVNQFSCEQENALVLSLRGADKELVSIESRGPMLSAGAAAAKLIIALANGLCGLQNIVASAFVRSNALPVCRFFTTELEFGRTGVQRNLGLPKVSAAEVSLIEQAIPLINEYTNMGINAVHAASQKRLKGS